jgi:FRG domain-containing protein
VFVQRHSWNSFVSFLRGYSERSQDRRVQLWFRGQPNAKWKLRTSLDRLKTFGSDRERNAANEHLLAGFRREAIRVGLAFSHLPDGDALDLLARHYGLPSPILDWTESPYIAAYFAFENARPVKATDAAAIWMIDRAKLPEQTPVEFIDDVELVRFNKRALQQRGVFIRVPTILKSVEQLLDGSLTKFEIPAIQRSQALAELSEMTIDSTHLFGDLESAARTATLHAMT